MYAVLSYELNLLPWFFGVRVPSSNNLHSVSDADANKIEIRVDDVKNAYESSYRNFFGYAYSLVLSRDTAHDIVQNVFARIVNKVNKDGWIAVENFEAYVVRSIRNEHIDRRAKEIRRSTFLHAVPESSPSAETAHFSEENNEGLKAAIEKLPTAQRTCLSMYYFSELKISEISRELSISESAVKTHLKRAKDTLSKSIPPSKEDES